MITDFESRLAGVVNWGKQDGPGIASSGSSGPGVRRGFLVLGDTRTGLHYKDHFHERLRPDADPA